MTGQDVASDARTGQLRGEVKPRNNQYVIAVVLSWLTFWSLFLSTKTNMNVVLGLVTITWAFIVVFVLPLFMSLSVVFPTPNSTAGHAMFSNALAETNVNKFVIRTVYAVLLSFTYVMTTGLLLASLYVFSTNTLLVTLLIFPLLVIIARHSVLLIVLKCGYSILAKQNFGWTVPLILIATLAVRYPAIISSETAIDSYLFHNLTDLFLTSGGFDWALSPLSHFQLFPGSVIPSPMVYVGSLSLLSSSDVAVSAFVCSVGVGLISTLSFALLIWVAVRSRLLPIDAAAIAMILYTFMPLLLKFTDWTMTGRQMFFLVGPSALTVILADVYGDKCSTRVRIGRWGLVSFALMMSHGMGRILIVFGFMVLLCRSVLRNVERDWQFAFVRPKNLGIILNRIAGYISGHNWFILSILSLVMMLLPYMLLSAGIGLLVNPWVLTRFSITSSWPLNLLTALVGFFIIFTSRMGFVSPLLIVGLVTLSYWGANYGTNMRSLILALSGVFPLFAFAMYFYQALSFILVLIASIACYNIFDYFAKAIRLRERLPDRLRFEALVRVFRFPEEYELNLVTHPHLSRRRNVLEIRTLFIVALLISSVTTGVFIQNYRYLFEGATASSDLVEMSSFISTMLIEPDDSIYVEDWTSYLCEPEDEMILDGPQANLTVTYDGSTIDNDWLHSNSPSIAGWNMVIEIHCIGQTYGEVFEPYLKVSDQDDLRGDSQEWPLSGISNWRILRFKISRLESVESVGIHFVTTYDCPGPTNLSIDYVRITSQPIAAIASNIHDAQRIGAFAGLPVFPMSDVLFLSHFRHIANVTIIQEQFSFSFQDIATFLRNGPFRLDIGITEMNSFCFEGPLDEFLALSRTYSINLLCHKRTDRWPLLETLVESSGVVPFDSWGEYDLYRLTIT